MTYRDEQERTRMERQESHEKKFGKDPVEHVSEDERNKRNDAMLERMRSKDRGFHHSDIHKAAEELRHEGKGSHDPMYEDSKKGVYILYK